MKTIYIGLISLLIFALGGIAVTAVTRTQEALRRGSETIESADRFIAYYEGRR